MRRGAVDVPPVVLDVLAVVALWTGQSEHPLLEEGVGAVPQREREAPGLLVVADTGHAVLAPPISTRAGVVVREEVPCFAIGAVVLADTAPRAFSDVRSPASPVGDPGVRCR